MIAPLRSSTLFREFVSTAPEDFKFPMIIALLPVMGTLTSYLKADYYDFTTGRKN